MAGMYLYLLVHVTPFLGKARRYKETVLMEGLVPYGDFVIAWSGGPLHSENDFYTLIADHVDKALRLFVYNSDLELV
jgi:hypothetical protein